MTDSPGQIPVAENEPRAIFNNTAALAVSTLVVRAGSIVLALVIARLNHAAGLGVYSTALAYYGLIGLAGGMGATSYLVREISKDRDKTSYYVTHLSVMCACLSLLFVSLVVVVVPHLGYSEQLATAIYVVMFGVFAGALGSIQRAVFVAHQKVALYAYTSIAATILNLLVSLYLLTHGYGVVSVLVAFVIQEYIAVLINFVLISRFIVRLTWSFRLASAVQVVHEIKTFTALSILAGVFAKPEIIILSLVENEVEVGIYIAAYKLVVIWYLLPQLYMTNVFPALSRTYQSAHEKFQFIQERSIKYLLVVSLPLSVGIIAASESIIHVLYGPGFEASVLPLQILALTIPCTALMAVLWRVLAARNQQALDLRARIISIVARLGGGVALISSFAALGAAIIVPTAIVLNLLLLLRYVKREGANLQIVHLSWRCALAALGMGVVTWSLRHSLQLWALVLVAAAVYAALVYVLRVFSPKDITLFRKIWQPATLERS